MRNTILIHAWNVEKRSGKYLLPYSHWIYLKEINKYFDKVVLLAPCLYIDSNQFSSSLDISVFNKTTVYELPFNKNGYVGSLKYILSYVESYYLERDVDTYYSRYPTHLVGCRKYLVVEKTELFTMLVTPLMLLRIILTSVI